MQHSTEGQLFQFRFEYENVQQLRIQQALTDIIDDSDEEFEDIIVIIIIIICCIIFML
jgi:hypothetical protein